MKRLNNAYMGINDWEKTAELREKEQKCLLVDSAKIQGL